MVKSLEELKEIATHHLSLQLEMLKELPTLNLKDALYFGTWYPSHPLQDEIQKWAIGLGKLKKQDFISK